MTTATIKKYHSDKLNEYRYLFFTDDGATINTASAEFLLSELFKLYGYTTSNCFEAKIDENIDFEL